LTKLALGIASCLLTLFALEVALRVYGYDPLRRLTEGRDLILRRSPHPDVKYELTPGAAGRAWGADIRINSHGFRGPEPIMSRRPRYRVIVLGDSVTFGNFLPVETTFPFQVQKRLEAEGVEVLNFAVGGYDTVQEVAALAVHGPTFPPDLVVLAYCLNDIGIVSVNLEYIERVEAQQASLLYRLRLAQLVADRLERARLASWLARKNDPEVFRREHAHHIDPIGSEDADLIALMNDVPDVPTFAWYRDRDRVGRLRFAFRRLADLSREHRFQVAVLILPWLTGDTQRYPYDTVHHIVAREARRAGFDVIDPRRELLRDGAERLRVHARDLVHLNQEGHAILTEVLAPYVAGRTKTRGRWRYGVSDRGR
jgi:lysophospholipase L1-like esterase